MRLYSARIDGVEIALASAVAVSPKFDAQKTRELLKGLGATEVSEVEP